MIDRWLWMWNYRKPIIAQVHGYCLSGGLDLIGACDIVWAAEGTLFGHPAARGMGIPVTVGDDAAADRRGGDQGAAVHRRPDRRRGGQGARPGPPGRCRPTSSTSTRRRVLPAHRDEPARHPAACTSTSPTARSRSWAAASPRMEGAEFDAIAHLTPSMDEFGRRVDQRRPARRARLARRPVHHRTGGRPRRRRPAPPLMTAARCGCCTPPTCTSARSRRRQRASAQRRRRRDRPEASTSCCSSATSSTTTACPPRSARSWPTSWPASTCPSSSCPATTTASCPHSIWRRVDACRPTSP